MNNKEYTEAYLNWSAESVDKTLDAFDRHLQAQEDRRIVETAYGQLWELDKMLEANGVDDWYTSEYGVRVASAYHILSGNYVVRDGKLVSAK